MNDHYSFWANAIIEKKIGTKAKLVILVILNHYTESGIYLNPTIDTLIKGTGMSRKVFIKHLQKAHASGFAEITTHAMEQINGR